MEKTNFLDQPSSSESQTIRYLIVNENELQAQKIKILLEADLNVKDQDIFWIKNFDQDSQQLKKIQNKMPDVIYLQSGLESLLDYDFMIQQLEKAKVFAPDATILVVAKTENEKASTLALRHGAQDFLVEGAIDGFSLKRKTFYARERKALRRELEKSNVNLHDLNQQKIKFLGMAAHDLRGPLGTIGGFAEVLIDELSGKTSEENIGLLKSIQKSSQSLLRLVSELLDTAQIESGHVTLQLKPLDLAQLIEQNVKTSTRLAKQKNITIRSKLIEGCRANMDSDKINQVLDNLISNAIKYSPFGSEIDLQMKIEKNWVEVAIQDQGQGIPPEELKKLFMPFVVTSVRPTGGEKSTGLGLSIVKKIVQEHGGRVEVKSTVGKGSTFYFRLPLHYNEGQKAA